MCELFAVSGKAPVQVNSYLKEFASHSEDNPNGWGMAVFQGAAVLLEKEPISAIRSLYLKERLRRPLEVVNMTAHIRKATRGNEEYLNCHPFVQNDNSGVTWTLVHNGTIFDCPLLNNYLYSQQGTTDSERILCHIVTEVNKEISRLGRNLTDKERFDVVDKVVLEITPNNNKVNLIIYDGFQFYVHTNMKGTLFLKRTDNAVFFATKPLDSGYWEPAPFLRLVSFRDGSLLYSGTKHLNEYFYNERDLRYIHLEWAEL